MADLFVFREGSDRYPSHIFPECMPLQNTIYFQGDATSFHIFRYLVSRINDDTKIEHISLCKYELIVSHLEDVRMYLCPPALICNCAAADIPSVHFCKEGFLLLLRGCSLLLS